MLSGGLRMSALHLAAQVKSLTPHIVPSLDVHKCRQCWAFFTPWYACRIVMFNIIFDTYDIYLYIWNVWNGNGNEVDGVQEGNTECAAALLAVGANVRAVNARGQVVVSLFADCQWINFVQYALHLAALAQSPETLELLLAKGWLSHSIELNILYLCQVHIFVVQSHNHWKASRVFVKHDFIKVQQYFKIKDINCT